MRFGKKFDERDASRASTDTSDRWIKYFKNGDTEVVFLDDLDEWTGYWEHFDPTVQRSYPCTNNKNSCPGCTSDNERTAKASKRYLVNCIVDGYVDLYKIPSSLINRAKRLRDKYETLTNHSFVITRVGTGMSNTEYDMDAEDAVRIKRADYEDKVQDHEEALRQAYIEVFGSLPDEAEEVAPRKRVSKPEPVAEPEAPTKRSKYDDDPPSEPRSEKDGAAEGTDESDDETVLSEEEVRAMTKTQLLALYKQVGIAPPEVTGKLNEQRDQLADHLIRELT